ncbi:MAG: hypothetical protein AAF458_25150 [Pseudomonadota bacterium]
MIDAVLEELTARVNANAALVRRGRWVNLTFLFGIDDTDYLVRIAEGRVVDVKRRVLATDSGVFCIRARSEVWREHWQPVPRRDYHDIWSMLPRDLAQVDGDLLPLIQNLQYFKDVIASPRGSVN